MIAIAINPAHADDEMLVPFELVRHLRLLQHDGISFELAWDSPPTFQEVGLSRAQAHCLWELVQYDSSQQTSEYETLLAMECLCEVGKDGVGWVILTDKELRFTPESRWVMEGDIERRFQYFHLAGTAIGHPCA